MNTYTIALANAVAPYSLDRALSLVPANPGRAGWIARWGAAARAACAVQEARERREAEEAKKLLPIWGAVAQTGQHSFTGCLYGFKPVMGAGTLTYDEARRNAAEMEAANAAKITFDRANWQSFMR